MAAVGRPCDDWHEIFWFMFGSIANNIIQDADAYRKIAASESNAPANSRRKRKSGVLAGLGNWLDVQIVKRFGSLFNPRTSH